MFGKMQTLAQRKKRGFTLVELAIVLSITALLAAGLWRMMASGNTQVRDQAVADQQRDLINATRAFLESPNGQGWRGDAANFPNDNSTHNLPFIQPGFSDFLPQGFDANTTNAYGQTYAIQVKRLAGGGYSFMIKTDSTTGETIPDTSGGRISSAIGNDGGFVYNANVCGAPANRWACGAFGTWNAQPGNEVGGYGFAAVHSGEVASRTFVGNTDTTEERNWLARRLVEGDVPDARGVGTLNTVDRVNLSLGNNTMYVDNGGSIRISADGVANVDSALEVNNTCETDRIDGLMADGRTVCNDSATIAGPVSITGLLRAQSLFAGRFIYCVGDDCGGNVAASDQRLKQDITPLTGVLDKLSKVKGYSFVMKDGGDKKYGVIAQEVEQAFPDVVHEIGNGYKGVDYIGLIGPVIAAVNELRAENEQLKADLAKQAKEIEALKAKAK